MISKVVPKIWARTNSAMMTVAEASGEKDVNSRGGRGATGETSKTMEQLDCCSRGR